MSIERTTVITRDAQGRQMPRHLWEVRTEMVSVVMQRRPGSLYALAGAVGVGVYAVSTDGRFRVTVSRHRAGRAGDRNYRYTFSAIDTVLGSAGKSYREIPVAPEAGRYESSSIDCVMAAIQRYTWRAAS